VRLLENPVQPYAWGSLTAIAGLLGRPPSATPEAELWLGAHASAPSTVVGPAGLEPLSRYILYSPVTALGREVLARFGPNLPFLLKVLAAAHPLSLQAHPSLQQAQEGFSREEALGVPRSAAHRNYRDPNHKPELLCALSEFHALCGFRRTDESVALLEGLGLDASRLKSDGIRGYFEWVMTRPVSERADLARAAVAACRDRTPPGFARECGWAAKLGAQYPGDVGVLGALLLNLVTLKPGEALYLPAGKMHAYLEGVAMEIMASSDNVLRGGLTPKHIDVPELLKVLDFHDGPIELVAPQGDVAVYQTPAPDFELTRLRLTGNQLKLSRRGPDILLVVEGAVELESGSERHRLHRGASVFVDAAESSSLTVSGEGVVFRATVGR
jgi:mannose-6-phosphate isomerase